MNCCDFEKFQVAMLKGHKNCTLNTAHKGQPCYPLHVKDECLACCDKYYHPKSGCKEDSNGKGN